jgi:uncharacterized membrane protein (DUF373 family)
MHCYVAFVLIAIAIALLVKTTWTLITASGPFLDAASAAVGEVLIVLIIVEIARTVFATPDVNGVAIRRLIVIATLSALREVLWVSVSPALATNGSSVKMTDKPLATGIAAAVVFALVLSFALVRRAGGRK